jgi:hypothetical protein
MPTLLNHQLRPAACVLPREVFAVPSVQSAQFAPLETPPLDDMPASVSPMMRAPFSS